MHKFLIVALFVSYSALGQVNLRDDFCSSQTNEDLCAAIIESTESAFENNPQTLAELRASLSDALENAANNPQVLNSIVRSTNLGEYLSDSPLSLEFKMIDREDADSVIGLEFGYNHEFKRDSFSGEGSRKTEFEISFNLNGTVTQESDENPRNFIETKIQTSFQNRPVYLLPVTNDEVALVAKKALNDYCNIQANYNTDLCKNADFASFDDLFARPEGLHFFNYGLDLGFETDQRFDAQNKTISAFASYVYRNYNVDNFIGKYRIKPSVRVSIDSVTPNSETPRAMAGDDSDYERLSYEFTLTIPLKELFNVPYTFGYNFRGYEELGASDLVVAANLDSYRLRTYSLYTPIGIVASYSSGRLPFGVSDENIVSLGFQTYF